MATKNKFLEIARGTINQWVDYDGAYGSQCVDEVNTTLARAGYAALPGNAIDLLDSARARGWQTFRNVPGQNPKAGDILVYGSYSHRFGHTGILLEDSDGYTLNSVEANVDGNWDALYNGAPARHVVKTDPSGNLAFPSNDVYLIGWIRVPFEAEAPAPAPAPAPKEQPKAEAKGTDVPGFVKNEKGSFEVGVGSLNVRDYPSLKGNIVAQYKKGDVVNYDKVYNGAGFRWISYVSRSGSRRYVACRDTSGKPYGRFF